MILKITVETIHNERETKKCLKNTNQLAVKKNDYQMFSKFNKNYKLTDPRSSMKLEQEKHKENYSKAYYNKIA